MYIPFGVAAKLAVAGLQAAGRQLFRTGYFPPQWPLKLAVITSINKAVIHSVPLITVEEVVSK